MTVEIDGGVRIAWVVEGFEAVHVYARWRPRQELESFARDVADAALLNRTLPDLRVALRASFPGAFDMETSTRDRSDRRVIVRFHPPRGEPNPDPVL